MSFGQVLQELAIRVRPIFFGVVLAYIGLAYSEVQVGSDAAGSGQLF